MRTSTASAEKNRALNISDEPLWNKPEPCEKIDIITALNWYNVNGTDLDAATFLGVSVNIARHFHTLAWADRMATRGYVVTGKSVQTLAEMRERLRAMVASAPGVAH